MKTTTIYTTRSFLAMNRKIMEIVNSEDNGLRSYIGYNGSYICYICYKGSYICYIGYKGSNGGIKNEIH